MIGLADVRCGLGAMVADSLLFGCCVRWWVCYLVGFGCCVICCCFAFWVC